MRVTGLFNDKTPRTVSRLVSEALTDKQSGEFYPHADNLLSTSNSCKINNISHHIGVEALEKFLPRHCVFSFILRFQL